MSRRKKSKKPPKRDCSNCGDCIYICEGDYVCGATYGGPTTKLIMEEHTPTNDFFWCGGTKWQPQ